MCVSQHLEEVHFYKSDYCAKRPVQSAGAPKSTG